MLNNRLNWPDCFMKQKSGGGLSLFTLPVLTSAFLGLLGLVGVFAAANTNKESQNVSLASGASAARTIVRLTPNGAVSHYMVESNVAPVVTRLSESRVIRPSGNTLWMVDDQNAIADGVVIDANNVWGAWTLSGAHLSIYPINGNGTESWHFSSFNSGNSGVAAAKGADRL